MKIIVLDAKTFGDDISLAPLAALGNLTIYENTPPEKLAERVKDCEVLIQNKVKITREVIAAAPRLRLICEAATGYDNIDVDAAHERGIAVCNVPGYSTDSVVQVTLAMVLSLVTNLPAFAAHVESGAYSRGRDANCLTPTYHELTGKVFGVVGYGSIGKKVADVARALGCDVIYTRAHPDGSPACVEPDELCRRADVITLHTPLCEETRGMIDRRRLTLMKPGVVLVNMARGAVVDEAAVADALQNGKIGAFGTDVYSAEPLPEDHPLFALRDDARVLMTPHMAWGSYEARHRCLSSIVENIQAFLDGTEKNRI